MVRKVVSLGECEAGAVVLERVAREHGCVGRVATIPQVLNIFSREATLLGLVLSVRSSVRNTSLKVS